MTSSRSTPEAALRRRSSSILPKVSTMSHNSVRQRVDDSSCCCASTYDLGVLTSNAASAYDLGVHNTLKLGKQRGRGAMAMPSSGLEADLEEHVLPVGVGTFSIRQVPSSAAQSSRGEAASHGDRDRGLHGSRTEGAHRAESGARAHSGPSTMWQDSGTDQRSRSKTTTQNIYCSTPVFSAPDGSSFFQQRERDRAAAAALIKVPTRQDQSIQQPSSGEGPR
jgi:hypothetical protein